MALTVVAIVMISGCVHRPAPVVDRSTFVPLDMPAGSPVGVTALVTSLPGGCLLALTEAGQRFVLTGAAQQWIATELLDSGPAGAPVTMRLDGTLSMQPVLTGCPPERVMDVAIAQRPPTGPSLTTTPTQRRRGIHYGLRMD
ncbi:hypothetical protein D5S17_35895 [Pseudonocardiaceae bacterium YIM PH 21723]|nr:hypothetical protein D5S17_35895 [Pseudonocardiaceae bacterium YIM PH 21723]